MEAITEDELQLLEEVLHVQVLVVLQLFVDSAKIHGVCDDVMIVSDAQLLWHNWLVENPGLRVLHQMGHHSPTHFFPVI